MRTQERDMEWRRRIEDLRIGFPQWDNCDYGETGVDSVCVCKLILYTDAVCVFQCIIAYNPLRAAAVLVVVALSA